MTTTDMIVDEAERLQARVRELETALWKYGQHHPLCKVDADTRTRCDCGYTAALTPSEPRR